MRMILSLKGKASQALTDLIVLSLKWILSSFLWIKTSTLVSFPPHHGAFIAFFSVFINENMQRWSGSIIPVQCQKAPLYPFRTIVQCVSKLTERDVFYETQKHMMKFGLYPLCPPEYRQGYSMETFALPCSRSKMTCSLTYYAHRVTELVFLDW